MEKISIPGQNIHRCFCSLAHLLSTAKRNCYAAPRKLSFNYNEPLNFITGLVLFKILSLKNQMARLAPDKLYIVMRGYSDHGAILISGVNIFLILLSLEIIQISKHFSNLRCGKQLSSNDKQNTREELRHGAKMKIHACIKSI